MKSKKIIKNIAYIALFSSLTFLGTYFFKIPYAGGAGYFNLGDAFILFSTIYLGPFVGLISGIIGASLGDLASGFVNFIGFTVLAKGLESIVTFILYYLLKKHTYLKYTSLFIGPLFMVITYFISYIIFYDLSYAYLSSGFDILQGLSNSVLALSLLLSLNKVPFEHYDFNKEIFSFKHKVKKL